MNEQTEEQRTRNWKLLWDLRRNVRYFAKRAGWFDAVHRLSCLLCFIGASGAFAAFAGNWPRAGFWCSGLITLLSAVCAQYDYPKKAALCRTLRSAYLRVLEQAEAAGRLEMSEADCRRLTAAYRRVERTLEAPLPATLMLLMSYCENEVAERDMEERCDPVCVIPRWLAWLAFLVRQVWFWRWPAKPVSKEEKNEPAK